MTHTQLNTAAATSKNDHQLFYPNLITSTLADQQQHDDDDEILLNAGSSSSSIDERLSKLEEQVANLQATTLYSDLYPSQRQKKAPRKGTMADVDAKLATILDILAKVVCTE